MHLIALMQFSVSPTLAINERIKNMHEVYNFGLGQSPFPTIYAMQEQLRKSVHQHDYLPVQGLPTLRDEIASFHNRRYNLSISSEQILIGPGSKELLFSLQFCTDTHVIIPSPCWVTYIPQCEMLGKSYSIIPCEFESNWKLTPELLTEHLTKIDSDKPRQLILNYPNNPVGCTYSKRELEVISRICDEAGLTIVSDEIYCLLTHTSSHYTMASFSDKAIISSGISKWAGAGGWRLGYMIFPEHHSELLQQMIGMVSETYTSTSAPIQYAAIEAFKDTSDVSRYLERANYVLSAIANRISVLFADLEKARISTIEGGFYFFLDLTAYKEELNNLGLYTSEDLSTFLIEHYQIAALPGSCFGRPISEFSMRFAYVNFDGGVFLEEKNDLTNEYVLSHCRKLTDGLIALKKAILTFSN